MIRIATLLVFFISTMVSAQTKYDEAMGKAFGLWGDGKSTEASAMFERIAAAEKTNWLPSYYVALVNTTEAFKTKDKTAVSALLTKAQLAQDNAMAISPNNAELLVMQALIHTAWVAFDPMTNGMKLSGPVNELYAKAMVLAPNNPRVVFSKAEWDMGSAKFFGKDIKPMCAEVARAVALFKTFTPESKFHPKWGVERAEETLAQCNK